MWQNLFYFTDAIFLNLSNCVKYIIINLILKTKKLWHKHNSMSKLLIRNEIRTQTQAVCLQRLCFLLQYIIIFL